MRAFLLALLIPVALALTPEACQQHGPPFGWRAKVRDAAMDGTTRLQPPPRHACVLVRA